MRLVAIFLRDHILYNKPQSINFGGKYIYTFSEITNRIERIENEKFIDNFYLSDTVTLLSAIVGKNGAGKTSLLTSVIDIIHDRYSFEYIAFFEKNQDTFYKSSGISINTNFKIKVLKNRLETIYYSPFLDYKDQHSGIDLSLDAIIEKDLENINDFKLANDAVNPNRRLQTKNWFRQIEFQDSVYGQALKDFFDFPDYNQNRLSFTRYNLDVDKSNKINFWNTPNNFREAVQIIYNKIEDEAAKIRPNRKDIIVLQKELLKNYILLDFLSLFIVQMEKSNDFLQEGEFETDNKSIEIRLAELSAKDSIIYFLDKHYYKVRGKKIKILPVRETQDFIEALFKFIDKVEANNDNDTRYFDWSRKALYLEKEDTKNIISLQNKFLDVMDSYYGSEKDDKGNRIFNRSDRVSEIVNFEPSDRKLSSGENALLNLYSRIYDFFNKNIIRLSKTRKADFYYLLLDEADLGFHPRWKKKFVKSILKFSEIFLKI